ncbi:hypothetical protein M758_UG064100 [Ceratodon purpureus]|nr:hypothetical protein M758_UG064100 [Ceratodon purpureus]
MDRLHLLSNNRSPQLSRSSGEPFKGSKTPNKRHSSFLAFVENLPLRLMMWTFTLFFKPAVHAWSNCFRMQVSLTSTSNKSTIASFTCTSRGHILFFSGSKPSINSFDSLRM